MIAGFLYRQSDKIVVVTPAFKEHLVENWKVPAAKISVVPNGVETELFSPEKGNSSLKKELGAEDKFIACYIGTMGMAHGLETIFKPRQSSVTVLRKFCSCWSEMARRRKI